MDKDTLQKAKELEWDIKSITRILEEHNKHHWVQVVSPKTDDGQSERFQDDLAEWLRQRKEIYEKELAAVCFFSDAGVVVNDYFQISSYGRFADCIRGL